MKIALCLAGQYRTFDDKTVQMTLKNVIFKKYDCDVYCSIWDNRGISLNHGNPIFYKDSTEIITDKHIKDYIPNCTIEISNYNKWYDTISIDYKNIIETTGIVTHAIPQLYKKHRAFELIPKEKKYDFIIVTRPDVFFFEHLNIEQMVGKENTIWNFNAENSWAFHPSRIYDILYMGSHDSVAKLSQCYYHVKELLDDPYHSNLRPTDCCKMLYLYAIRNCHLNVQSTPSILGNVYRNYGCIQYNLNNCNLSSKIFEERFLS